jgi:hypothetical protein
MNQIFTTSGNALNDQVKNKRDLNQKQLEFLMKGLKLCESIPDGLLIRLIVCINDNALLK